MEAMDATIMSGATIDAESHLISGRVSSKGALAGSRKMEDINQQICGTWQLFESILVLYRCQEAQSCKNKVCIQCFFQVKSSKVSREKEKKPMGSRKSA